MVLMRDSLSKMDDLHCSTCVLHSGWRRPGHHRRMPIIALDDLRRHAVARTLFAPAPLPRALQRLGFVQADPLRAPARAQDLILRHRARCGAV